MGNVWLLEPALDVYKNMAACRNKASQTSVYYLLYFYQRVTLCPTFIRKITGELVGVVGNNSHKYATEATLYE